MIVVRDAQALAATAAAWIAETVAAAVRERGACFLALAGGETPRACYQRLAQPPYQGGVPWHAVHVFWSDERRVPLDDPASNYAMARKALLDRVPVPTTQIHPLHDQERDAEKAAATTAASLTQLPRDGAGWPRFDLILLGLGQDGHTASLFPGDAALGEQSAWVRAVIANKPPPERLTFTLPVMNAARSVLFLVQGAGKRDALLGVRQHDGRLPASRVRPTDGELRFLVDEEALPPGS